MKALRRIIHSAHTFVRSVESNNASRDITLDHLIDSQIRTLKTKETRTLSDAAGLKRGVRKSKYDEIQSLQDSLTEAIKAIEEAQGDPLALSELGLYENTKQEGENDAPEPDPGTA